MNNNFVNDFRITKFFEKLVAKINKLYKLVALKFNFLIDSLT